jgi:hypothetical protein
MLWPGMATKPLHTIRVVLAAALAVGLGGCPGRTRHHPPTPPNSNIDLDPLAPPARTPPPLPPPTPPPPPVEEPPPPATPPPPPPRRVATGCGNGDGERFSVQGVAATDTLNVRSEPDPRASVLGQLQPDSTGVIGTEETARVGNSIWRKVRCQHLVGWVNERFLSSEGQPQQPEQPEPQPEPEAPVKKKSGTDPKLW